ncbi:glycosyltransferase family 2 protein [Mangrovimonas sp. CR14]|uniref:glycosyltransferase family 2 protein n=1 Tax=Mangrovimonas sp. CR14 TaxID=2706120 RepID=UPI001420FB0C|nr:glycosyltransferase family 2 protein [Mangrovimonas sp. CR14]NIK92525.1 glycosyltransferase family 2 protein [Mangrovimonas sp. CR14]
MMKTPLVSIIIPTYNRSHLIGETLDSVLAQTYTNWECIVVDDGSTDSTQEVVEAYCKNDARFQFHRRPKDEPKGGNAARNYGFKVSKGMYVNWFDSDDIMLNDFIEKKIQLFNSHKIQAIICSGFYTDSKLHIIRPTKYFNEGYLFKEFTLRKADVLTPSVLFKKESLESMALFNVELTDAQETDFFHRYLFDLPADAYHFIEDKLFLYRKHGNSIGSLKIGNYNLKNRASQAYVEFENLKRVVTIGDQEMIHFIYKALLNLLFLAMDHEDNYTQNYLLKGINSYKNKIGIFKYYFLMGYLKVARLINVRSYRLEKLIRNR